MKQYTLLKKGSKHKDVITLQQLLKNKGYFPFNIIQVFGPKTEKAVKDYQKMIGLSDDGIVGEMTWRSLNNEKLDSNIINPKPSHLHIEDYFLKDDEYVKEIITKTQIYLHHTASSHNPFRVIDVWEQDKFKANGQRKLQRISTAFVIGGKSINNKDDNYNGLIARCFNEKYWGYHTGWLGRTSDGPSIGIEICNYGYLSKNRNGEYVNYVGGIVPEEDVCDLGKNFRGHRYYHKYTDEQIESVRLLILDLSKRFNITIEDILYDLEWFDYNPKKWKEGKGIRTHTQVRKDKTDLSPQPNLIKMLNSLKC